MQLRRDGFPALAIHGDKSQGERDWVLSEFKSGKAPIMLATDVAARGLGTMAVVGAGCGLDDCCEMWRLPLHTLCVGSLLCSCIVFNVLLACICGLRVYAHCVYMRIADTHIDTHTPHCCAALPSGGAAVVQGKGVEPMQTPLLWCGRQGSVGPGPSLPASCCVWVLPRRWHGNARCLHHVLVYASAHHRQAPHQIRSRCSAGA